MNDKKSEAAATSGWELVDVYDTRGYMAKAIVPTPGSALATPYEARMFVWEAARRGDSFCASALSIVASSELHARPKRKSK